MVLIETDVELTKGCARIVREMLPQGSGVTFRARVRENGNPKNLTGMSCVCHVMKSDGTAGEQSIGTASNGYAEAHLSAAACDMRGEVRLCLRVNDSETGERTTLAVLDALVA